MNRRLDAAFHVLGAAVNKVAPVGVQVVLLWVVARDGTLDDVGLLALASAAAFLCGALGEAGFSTTLSAPAPYFGAAEPPLRATRRLRTGAAVAASGLFALLWALGLGQHDPQLLIVLPLPFALAVSNGYAGAMNASGRLRIEGTVAAAESALVLLLALALTSVVPALTAALIGLTVGRVAGTLARMRIVRGVPQTAQAVDRVARIQSWFVIGTTVIVLQGQADMLIIGFAGNLALAGVYGPLLRMAYSVVLLAEALSWSLYGSVGSALERRAGGFAQTLWAAGLGIVCAVVFVLVADPVLEFILHRSVSVGGAIAVLGVLIVVRFVSFSFSLRLIRAGRQRAQVPVLALACVVLIVGALFAAAAVSIVGFSLARLASEVVLVVGYALLVRQTAQREASSALPQRMSRSETSTS